MPAKRATSSGFPLGLAGNAASTAAESSTKAEAVAVRRVSCLALTSTMLARPDESKCESCGCEGSGMGLLREAKECGRLLPPQVDGPLRALPGSNWSGPG